jgi:hypothetical protein
MVGCFHFLSTTLGTSVTSPTAYRATGVFPAHGLPELDIALPEGLCHGGRPHPGPLGPASDKGESVKVDRWRLEVLDVQRRATTRVRLLLP